jgi:hypothetical protein
MGIQPHRADARGTPMNLEFAAITDLTVFLYQRMRDYCIGKIIVFSRRRSYLEVLWQIKQ